MAPRGPRRNRRGSIEPFDAEHDGDLDLLIGPNLVLNDGSGAFVEQPDALGWIDVQTGVQTFAIDADRDGEWDVLGLPFGGEPRLVHGIRRQLDRVSIPQLGQPLKHRLRGPAGQPWFLGLSFGTASIPLPGLGWLMLNPSAVLLVGVGILDGSGAAQVTIPAVSDPAFDGLVVYWQAIVGDSPKFTNQERTLLHDL